MSCKDIILRDNNIKFYFRYLEWDSCFFNRSSFYLDIDESNLGISEKIKSDIFKNFPDSFITVKLETQIKSEILIFLQDCGFYYIDTEVVLKSTQNRKREPTEGIKVVKNLKNVSLPYNKLGSSFYLTRFHSDPKIDDNKADLLWINYLKGYELCENKHMFSAQINGECAGVILVNLKDNEARLFFVAVLEEFRGLGVGKALINKLMEYFKSYTITAGTQVKNLGAMNFYIDNGLDKIAETSTVLHRWG